MWSTAQIYKRCKDFMLIFNETIDELAMGNSVRWYGHVFRRELNFEVEGQWKTGEAKEDMEETR